MEGNGHRPIEVDVPAEQALPDPFVALLAEVQHDRMKLARENRQLRAALGIPGDMPVGVALATLQGQQLARAREHADATRPARADDPLDVEATA